MVWNLLFSKFIAKAEITLSSWPDTITDAVLQFLHKGPYIRLKIAHEYG